MTHQVPFHETAPSGPMAALASQMQALIPVLKTERLILRGPRIEDFDAFAAMGEGPRGQFYGRPKTRDDAWANFMQLTGTWALRGHGAWTVTDRTDGAILGFVQIGAEPGDMEPELGWIVSYDAEGHGLAFEAAQAVRAQGFGPFALAKMVSSLDARNSRSQALAQRLGAKRDTDAEARLPEAEACFVFRHNSKIGA